MAASDNGCAPAERDPWLGVELRHLAALAAVARTGSFRGAADDLGYVQSAVSQQVAFLEQLVGQRLLHRARGAKGVAVTEAGEVLLAHAERIVARMHAARADLDELLAGGPRAVRVGVPHGVAAGLLPGLLKRLAVERPEVHVEAVEASLEQPLLDELAEGRLDLALADLPLTDGPFEACDLTRDEHVLIVPEDSRLARGTRQPALDTLADVPLIMHDAFPRIEGHLRGCGLEPDVVFRSGSTATIEAVVAGGIGSAIVPRLALGPERVGTCRLDGDALVPARVIGMCWHRERRISPALAAVCDAARAECEPEPALALVAG